MTLHTINGSKGRLETRFSGFRLLGLGFWQAWWMIAMCTDAMLPNENRFLEAGSATLLILVMTTLGYLLIVLASKRFSPLNGTSSNFILAGGLTAVGSLLLPVSLTALDGVMGFSLFIASGIAVSIGNAILLIMWGELWSALATGRVGRHLYFSYAFAFILFFIAYFLPSPFDSLFTAALPLVSAAILRSGKHEPRRSPSMTPIDKKSIPYKRIFLCIFLISILYGFSQGVMGTFSEEATSDVFIAQSLFLAGGAISAMALSMVITNPEAEPIALYRPIIPAMACGFIALLLFAAPLGFVGGGLVIVGIYCLDMLIMLVSTDIAYRARIPVALSFGAGILASRTGTLCGSIAAHAFVDSVVYSEAIRNDILLIGVVVLIFIGMLFFTQADFQKLYQRPAVASDATSACVKEKCTDIASMCNLTTRETEVLVLLARGKTVQGVCDELTIARGTAKHHVSNIYRKVGVYDRQGLLSVVEQGAVGRNSYQSNQA